MDTNSVSDVALEPIGSGAATTDSTTVAPAVPTPRKKNSTSRANSVPLLNVDKEEIKKHIAVSTPVNSTPDETVEDDEAEYSDEEDSQSKLLDKHSRSIGTSAEIDLDTSGKVKIEDSPPPKTSVEPSAPRMNNVIPTATMSASTCTADDETSPSKTITPTATILYQSKKDALKSGSNGAIAEVILPPKDKTQHQDKLLANLGPAPQIVKTIPVDKKKKRSLLSKFFFSGVVEEGDGLYEQGSGGGSGPEDGGVTTFLHDGRVRVEEAEEPESETSLSILMQVMLPFLVAGLGMVGAGLVLDTVQHWDVFMQITELFIMVPALLGLKGNLEMTLASRLSTHANMGHLDKTDDCISMIVGNLALIQCQAIVVGFLASVAAVVMGWIPEGDFSFLHALLLCAAALVTASFASFILGVIMVAVIMLARKCNINPDNVATPIAASLGDLITLGLLSWIASLLFEARGSDTWLAPLIIAVYVLSLPLWIWLASRNRHTKEVLYSGWTPVISAMMISSMGGVILDYTVASYKGIAVYQPVINGVGGNLVAVQASRISTALHLATPLGRLPRYAEKLCHNPGTVFCTNAGHAKTARVLLLLVIPGHLVFAYTISYLKAGHTSLTPIFVIIYLCAALLQVIILLYMSVVMVHWMWSVCIDPDNSAIPYLTAFGDLLGTGLLAIAFQLLYMVGDKDSDLGD